MAMDQIQPRKVKAPRSTRTIHIEDSNSTFTLPDLPVEILQRIFCAVMALYPNGLKTYKILAIAHVCRHWRLIALNTPELFTDIPLSNREFMNIALAKSAPLPIALSIDEWIPSSSYIDDVREAMLHISRFKRLQICVDDEYSDKGLDIQDLLRSPAPLLETLVLLIIDSCDAVEVPVDAFGGHFPNLRVLFLGEVEIAFNHPLLRASITSLVLWNVYAWETVNQMLDTFDAMPNLEIFQTSIIADGGVFSVLQIPRPASPPTRLVLLPRIRSFTIEDRTPQLVMMIRHVRFPASASLYLLGEEPDRNFYGRPEAEEYRVKNKKEARFFCDDLAMFLSFHYDKARFCKQSFRSMAIGLRARDGTGDVDNILTLLPNDDKPGRVFPDLKKTVESYNSGGEPVDPPGLFWMQLSFGNMEIQFNAAAIVLRKVAAFTAPSVKSLQISYVTPFEGASHDVLRRDNWEDMFSSLDHIQKVEAVGGAAHTLVSHLYMHRNALFPVVRTVRLRKAKLLDLVDLPVPMGWMPLYWMLQHGTLKNRARQGILRRVEVQESVVDPQMMQDLASRLGGWTVRRVKRPEGSTWVVERPSGKGRRLRAPGPP